MKFLYNIATAVTSIGIQVTRPFNKKLSLMLNGHEEAVVLLRDTIAKDPSEKVWFHAASLGEFEQGRTVIEAYKLKYPDRKIVLTFFSPSGYEVRKEYPIADYILYLPFDTSYNAKFFVKSVNPVAAIFIKYEFWPNYIHQLHIADIPIYSISSIFRESQSFFKWYGDINRKALKEVTEFFVQDENSVSLLKRIGVEGNTTVAGDTRFDRVAEIVNQAKEVKAAERFSSNRRTIVAGSTWAPDEEHLTSALNSIEEEVNLIVAPHVVSSSNISRVVTTFKDRAVILFSEITEETDLSRYNTLIIDNIGMLSSLYRYGEIAYIGGGFGVGIHNTLEAATYGLPVLFGPNYLRFGEAVELIDTGGAFSIEDSSDLEKILSRLLKDPKLLAESGDASASFVQLKTGATTTIIESL